MSKWLILGCLLALTGVLTPASAQVLKGQIVGTVTDITGALVPNAKVTLTESNTNSQRAALTNESGNYFFVNLDPGVYQVEVERVGFQKTLRAGIHLEPNTTARANFELQPGLVAEVVDVTADAVPLLQTDRSDTGGKIEQRQLQNLPLLWNRNYQGLLLLIPGVGRPFRPHSVFYNSQDSLSVRVNGQGRQFNNFQIEGIENKIDNGNLTALVPPVEAIQAVDISTSNFDPEFGNAGGAVTNVTLRSGTNDLHGSLFHFHRNENIQARNTFAVSKAHTVYNQFGGTVGGRIVRDRMFFFGDFQGSRDSLGQVDRVTMPGMAFRAGDLSAAPTIIYDPQTGNSAGRGRVPFAGKRIPAQRISPIARRSLDFLPAPNLPVSVEGQQNFEKGVTREKRLNQFDVKYDWLLTPNDRVAVRYSLQQARVFDPGLYGPNGGIYGGPHNGGFSGGGPARTQSPGITFSKVISPTFVWESRFGVVRNRNDAINQDRGLNTSEEIGIKGANVDLWSSGLSYIQIGGYSNPVVGFSPSLPWARSVTTFGIVNNFSKTLSNHILRFGSEIRRERNDLLQTQTFNPRGRFYFESGQTGDAGDRNRGFANSFASFLLDVPNQSGRDLAIIFPARRELISAFYFQDKWQVSSKLTLDLGLRWEMELGSRPRFAGGFSNYNYFNNTLELAGLGDIPLRPARNDYLNLGPRVGVAYRIDSQTVVRAGYGISYIPRRMAAFNFPVSQNNAFPAANAFVPTTVTMAVGFPPALVVDIPSDGVIRNPDPRSNYGHVPRDLVSPYVESWNFAVQRALPGDLALEVAYVANHGVNNQSEFNLNASMVPGSGNTGRPLFQPFGRVANTGTFVGTHTYYHSLQVKLDRRFAGGFLLTTAYTWSKGLNFSEDNGGIPLPMNVALNKGRMSDNRTHSFVQSYLYDLPFGRGRRWAQNGAASWLLGGWQFQGILSLMSGQWATPSASASLLNAPGNAQRPDVVGPVHYVRRYGRGEKYFDPSAFALPAQNTLGNAGRGIIVGPGIINLDASLFRDFRVREGWSLTFRAESFNLSNTPHYSNPNSNLNSPQFGEVNGAAQDQRQLQFGLTLRF